MSDKQIHYKEIFWVSLACMGYFLLLLGSRALNVPDEGRYAEVAREMLLTGNYITPKLNGVAFFHKPILYYWLQVTSFSLFGISEWSIRLMPALCAVLGCVMTYITGTLLFSRSTGLLATLILATNPLYFLAGHYANMDLEVAVFIACALSCFIIAIQYPAGHKRRRNILWLAYGFAGLGVLTKGLIGIVLPMMVIGCWILLTNRWKLLLQMYLPSGLALFLLVTLPWFVAVQLHNPGFFDFFFIYQQFTRFSSTGFNNVFPAWFYPLILLVGFFPWSIVFLYSIRSSVTRILAKTTGSSIELFLWLWVVLITVFFSIPASKIVGYILPVMPALALLAAIGMGRLLDRIHPVKWYAHPLVAIAIAFLLIGLALFAAVQQQADKVQAMGMQPHLLALASVLFIAGLAIAILVTSKRTRLALAATTLAGALCCLVILSAAKPASFASSIKPLAEKIKPEIRPGDLIINYEKYYYDLGIYLQLPQPIIVVTDWQDDSIRESDSWPSEFYNGFANTAGEEQWMLDKEALKQRLENMPQGQSAYIFTKESFAPRLAADLGLQQIDAQNGIALLKHTASTKSP